MLQLCSLAALVVVTAPPLEHAPPPRSVTKEAACGDALNHRCQWVQAEDLAGVLQVLLDIIPPIPPKSGGVRAIIVAADPTTNTLLVAAPPHKLALARKLLDRIDSRPVMLGESEPVVRTYSVPGKASEAAMKRLREMLPNLHAFAVPDDNEITVFATPLQHLAIEAALPDITEAAVLDPVIRRYSVPTDTSDTVAKQLQKLEPSLHVIALNKSNEVFVYATPAQHEKVERMLKVINKSAEK